MGNNTEAEQIGDISEKGRRSVAKRETLWRLVAKNEIPSEAGGDDQKPLDIRQEAVSKNGTLLEVWQEVGDKARGQDWKSEQVAINRTVELVTNNKAAGLEAGARETKRGPGESRETGSSRNNRFLRHRDLGLLKVRL